MCGGFSFGANSYWKKDCFGEWVPKKILIRGVIIRYRGKASLKPFAVAVMSPNKVSFFTDENRQWNVGKLNEYLIPDDSEAVRNIPLARGSCMDDLYWFYDNCENYRVKSGYKQACNLEFDSFMGSSSGCFF